MQVYDARTQIIEIEIQARQEPEIRSRQADDAICRIAMEGEQPCTNGRNCQGNLTFGDILVAMGGRQGGLCLRCTRHETTIRFLKVRSTNQNISEAAEPITSYYNIVGKEGEYDAAQSLTTSDSKYQGLLMAVMPEYSSFYTRHTEGNVVYHLQTWYKYPGTMGDRALMYPKKVDLTPQVKLDDMASVLFDSSHIYIWNPLNMDNSQQHRFNKYCDLVVKLDDCEKHLETCTSRDERRTTEMQQDLLLPLSIQMEKNNSFADENVGDVNEEGLLVFEEDVLPEASTHLLNCSIWDAVKAMDYEMDADFVSILTNCFPKVSKEREFVALLIGKIKNQNQHFGDMIYRILLGGLLGISATCKTSANFRRRKALYKWYYFERTDISDWMTTNQTIVTSFFREYLFRSIRKVAPLYDFLCSVFPWEQNETRVFEMCDRIREEYNNTTMLALSSEDYQLDEYSIEKMLGRINWRGFPRFPVASKTETIIASFSAVAKTHTLDLPKSGSRLDDDDDEIGTVKEFVWKYASCLSETDLGWMELLFEIPADQALIEAINNINLAKPKFLTQAVETVFRRSLREFTLLKTFYTVLDQTRTMVVYKLPEFITLRQQAAYLKMYGTTTLPPHAGSYYYCRNCGSIKTKIPKRSTNNDPVSLSHTGTIFDVSTRSVYCRSAMERSTGAEEEDEVSKKSFRANLKIEQKSPCIEDKLSHINLIGKSVATKNQGTIIICPGCGLLTTLGRDAVNCGDSLLSCGCSLTKNCTAAL